MMQDRILSVYCVWKARWTPWSPVPNKTNGFCGRKATPQQQRIALTGARQESAGDDLFATQTIFILVNPKPDGERFQ